MTKSIQPIKVNSFDLEEKQMSISPISASVSNKTNDISFSIDESSSVFTHSSKLSPVHMRDIQVGLEDKRCLHANMSPPTQSVIHKSVLLDSKNNAEGRRKLLESSYLGIKMLKEKLQSSNTAKNEKGSLIGFLE